MDAKLGANIDHWSFEVTEKVVEVSVHLGHCSASLYEVLS